MPRFTIGRRTLLRGLGGSAVALPPLEIMGARAAGAQTAGIPRRFVQSFCGVSHGGNRKPIEDVLHWELW